MRKSILLILLIVQACSPYKTVDNFAQAHNFDKKFIQTTPFTIASFHRIKSPKQKITVYVEGDGKSYLAGGSRLSADPTSSSTMLFSLASNDPSENVIYMARPCQHSKYDIDSKICTPKYWASARYSTEIINSVNQALNQIKRQYNNKIFELVGFSGGGAIVALVAAERQDISKIRTIAGNLDLQAMDDYHKTIPLYESKDPLKIAKQIAHIPQVHYVGAKDTVVPPMIAYNFKQASGSPKTISIIEVPATHGSGWQNKVYD